MTRTLPLLASIISLSLSASPAAFGSGSESPPAAEDGVVNMFGHRLCLPQAPPESGCDWRLPGLGGLREAARAATADSDSTLTRFTLLGHPFCIDPANREAPLGVCTRRLQQDFEILGIKFCVGHDQGRCDVHLPAKEAMHAHK